MKKSIISTVIALSIMTTCPTINSYASGDMSSEEVTFNFWNYANDYVTYDNETDYSFTDTYNSFDTYNNSDYTDDVTQEYTNTEDAENRGTLLGSATIWSDKTFTNSWTNITHSADMLNGFELKPWEEFSFYNYFPGHCGYEEGFVDAPAYTESGVAPGSGVCFTSTGTYECAVLVCGLYEVERHDHYKPVTYAVKGEDAAVNLHEDLTYRQDMRFINDTENTLKFYYDYNSWTGEFTVSCYIVD